MKKKKAQLPLEVREAFAVIAKILPTVPDVRIDNETGKIEFLFKEKDGLKSLILIDHKKELPIAYRANGWPEVQQYIRLIRAIENKFYGPKHPLIAGE